MITEIILTIIIFSLYVQFSDSMGGIWIRKDSDNNNILCLNNLLILIFKPFTEWYFWSYNFLLINFWVYLIILLIIFNSIKFNLLIYNNK
jgi:hypothetical protein